MPTNTILTYIHTIRHLRFSQLYYRVMRRLMPPRHHRQLEREIRIRPVVCVLPSLPRKISPDGEWTFNFINIAQTFPPGDIDWKSHDKPKLWRYNLHYFDYLRDEGRSRDSCFRLIDDWIDLNPLGRPDAWEPYPASLRIVNWIKFFCRQENRESLKPMWLESLYRQLLWLENNVERQLLANHYFKNGKALVFGGMFFAGHDADRWLKQGVDIITTELDEQVLHDGGHFERSPMYHTMILEDCLDLLNLCKGEQDPVIACLAQRLQSKTPRMVHYLLGMTHPDGRIALFNDSAFGIEAEPEDLVAYYEQLSGTRANRPRGKAWSFHDTGYYVMAPHDGARLLIDCGPIGPNYQPGHAHSDTLSFELSLKGRRVIVDSGCFRYRDGDIRRYNRGNVGHNSVTVDGRNQSEVWGAHRCSRRARPLYGRLEERGNGEQVFAGAHEGYSRLAGKPVHHRTIAWAGDICRIDDTVEGNGRHDLEWRLHINPDFTVELEAGRAVVRDGAEFLASVMRLDGGPFDRTDGWYCPEFGIKQPCAVLAYTCNDTPLPFRGGWIVKTSI